MSEYHRGNGPHRLSLKFLNNLSPTRVISLGFIVLILVGTLLLLLPISTRDGYNTSLLDALFTATSAVCVTGLARFDTYTHWTLFGQVVIMLMIQTGGIGFITITLSFIMLAGKKIGLNQRILMQESVSAPQIGGIVKMTRMILRGTFLLEGIGAVLLALYFCPKLGLGTGIYFGIFHSVSAFCNAGFDLMGIAEPNSSLITVAANPYVNIIIMALIIIGGLGFFVWHDILSEGIHFKNYKLHTKVVLSVTAILIIAGAAGIYLFEREGSLFENKGIAEQLICSLFQSVTFRTAGFSTVSLSQMTQQSKILSILLMLIGGSPGSTAGGMKTTTFAILICTVFTTFRHRKSVELFKRRIDNDVLQTAVTIAVFYIGLSLCAALFISSVDNIGVIEALFESCSAIATVGSSLGITDSVGKVSEIILIFLMLVGRIGSVTFLLTFSPTMRAPKSQYPMEKISIG